MFPKIRSSVATTLLLTAVLLVTSASARNDAVPHAGEIVFTRTIGDHGRPNLYVIASNGSRPRLFIRNAYDAAVSPDGRRIAFGRNAAVWVMQRDGSGQHALTKPTAAIVDFEPAWSPTGRTLYFARGGSKTAASSLFSINPDGTALHRLTRAKPSFHGHCQYNPAPSPDGILILYTESFDCEHGTDYAISAITTAGLTARLTFAFPNATRYDPAWASDGGRIAYATREIDPMPGADPATGLYVSASSGASPVRLVRGSVGEPTWSRDDTLIAFVREVTRPSGYPGDIWLIRPNGKSLRRLTHTHADDRNPTWLPPST